MKRTEQAASPNDKLAELIRQAEDILVVTGAGLSTASGIPDFRGPDGVWKRRQPVYYQDFMTSETARLEHWDYKLEGWPAFRQAQPNPAHHALVSLERAGKLLLLVTQNIDGLHAQAGGSPERLVELHGTNLQVECQSCLERTPPGPHFELFQKTRRPPLCACGGYLKPATISFGQSLRREDLDRAFRAADRAGLVIALGSTLGVYPAAAIPLQAARRGVPYVIINRGPTDHDQVSEVTVRLEGDVVELFPRAVERALAGFDQGAPKHL